MHSAAWIHVRPTIPFRATPIANLSQACDWTGKRVAVIGTGSSVNSNRASNSEKQVSLF